MTDPNTLLFSGSAVAIRGRALGIEGPPGSGKSSLALALIDRGATLIGDDGFTLSRSGDQLMVSAPPNINGLIELRGIGLFEMAVSSPVPLALILSLGSAGERLPETAVQREIMGIEVPCLPFIPGTLAPALRAEMALSRFGIEFE